ncbi:MAG: galactokinase [Lachnospiraceae bacterium]|nr:galactokinase [Lachnospiraceae bacterium]
MELRKKFVEIFGEGGDIREYFAPGRVNLIGEHTDYNGGHVFPCALTIGTYACARLREDGVLRFYSENFPKQGVLETAIDDTVYHKELSWSNYPRGVIQAAAEMGYAIDRGMDILYYGTIPNSSGLSSSASIEILTGYVLRDLFGFDFDGVTNALIGQRAENRFIGVNCGIMDQFAISMGRKDSAIFLDTATLQYEYAPIELSGVRIVIMNTNKKRGLGDSKYNERRAECEQALAELKKVLPISSLGELDEIQFEANITAISSPICRKRARHAVYENQRTLQAVAALRSGDLAGFGELMNASHISLRDEYEVTGTELDTLVSAAWQQEGVIGARMTGAGFGGCAVSLVKEECVPAFIEGVGASYLAAIGYEATFYVVEIGDGPTRIS